MMFSDVELASCKLCKKPIASDRGECIHCGVSDPVEKKESHLWHYVIIVALLAGAVLATVGGRSSDGAGWDCRDGGVRGETSC